MSRYLRFYTALQIALGFGALAVVSILLRLDGRIGIDLPGVTPHASPMVGVAYWVVLSLAGSALAAQRPAGSVVTFDVPFIAAATVLGGPVAGGWVGMIGCLELREIRGMVHGATGQLAGGPRVPWYGVLVNHSQRAFAAIVGGLAVMLARPYINVLAGSGTAARDLVMTLLVAGIVIVLCDALSFETFALRSNRSYADALEDFGPDYWLMEAAESIVAWLMVEVFLAGWWGPVACVAALRAIWRGRPETGSRVDPLTGLWNQREFDRRTVRLLGRRQRGGRRVVVMLVELEDLDLLNRSCGRDVGDRVLKTTASRLRSSLRPLDDAARLEAGIFGLLLLLPKRDPRLPPAADPAEVIAWRIHPAITAELGLEGERLEIRCSIGVTAEGRTEHRATAEELVRTARSALRQAQEDGVAVAIHELCD